MDLKDYKLVWEDNFDYEGSPDPTKWNFEVGNHQWPNRELQAYTDRPQNVFVKDGKLTIRAIKEQDGEREYTSAKINTCGKHSWTYGYFEFKVKIPDGVGSWPAIWMMPEHVIMPRKEQEKLGFAPENMYWPNCGELDIMEHVGRRKNNLLFSLHCKNHNHANRDTVQYTTTHQFDDDYCSDYHIIGLEWTENYIEYLVDGESYCRYNKADDPDQSHDSWPFCKPFYLIFNIAVGGGLGGPVNDEDLPFEMMVDYVRVYQKK